MQITKNFTENEVLNPLFDDCHVNSLDELGQEQKASIIEVVKLVQLARDFFDAPIRLNSTIRQKKSMNSPHRRAKAIDFQLVKPYVKWGHDLFDYLIQVLDDYVEKNPNVDGCRFIWENSGKNTVGWIHVDINHLINIHAVNEKYKNLKHRLMVGYPYKISKNFPDYTYETYKGTSPMNLIPEEIRNRL